MYRKSSSMATGINLHRIHYLIYLTIFFVITGISGTLSYMLLFCQWYTNECSDMRLIMTAIAVVTPFLFISWILLMLRFYYHIKKNNQIVTPKEYIDYIIYLFFWGSFFANIAIYPSIAVKMIHPSLPARLIFLMMGTAEVVGLLFVVVFLFNFLINMHHSTQS